VIKNLFIFRL